MRKLVHAHTGLRQRLAQSLGASRQRFLDGGLWDATYPSYPAPDLSKHDPDHVKLEQITRYVREYNAQMVELAEIRPDSVQW